MYSRMRHTVLKDLERFEREVLGAPLPFIPGDWVFIDPDSGSNNANGDTPDQAFAGIETAYAAANDGDGIVLISGGATALATTAYLKKPLAWAKNGITLFGAAAPVSMFGRARIANKEALSSAVTMVIAEHTFTRTTGSFITDGWEVGCVGKVTSSGEVFTVSAVTALVMTVTESLTPAASASQTLTSYLTHLIDFQGMNNRVFGINLGNFSSHALSIGGVKVTGHRNFFGGCHMVGAGDATPGADAGAYSLLLDGAQESEFVGCVFGTDSVLKAAANGEIIIDGGVWRARFRGCETLSYSATSGKGAVKVADATAFSGWIIFERGRFLNWNENGLDLVAAAIIGTKPTSGQILLDSNPAAGFTANAGAGMSGCVYVVNAAVTASGAGGLPTSM